MIQSSQNWDKRGFKGSKSALYTKECAQSIERILILKLKPIYSFLRLILVT